MPGEPVSAAAAWWRRPRFRRALARVLVVIGCVLALVALLTARWGLLVAALLLVGLGAAAGPARAARARDDDPGRGR
jgi:CHASE2 domain-containing sensor protein